MPDFRPNDAARQSHDTADYMEGRSAMIEELLVQNFRGFKMLELKKLKRVNLVVGANNAGKTSLLEAILLMCNPHLFGDNKLPELLRNRQGNELERYFRWLLRDGAEDGRGELRCHASGKNMSRIDVRLILLGRGTGDAVPGGVSGEWFSRTHVLRVYGQKSSQPLACRTTSFQQNKPEDLVAFFGKAQRKADGEETLQRLLSTVDPRIRRIRVDPGVDGNQVIVDIGLSEAIPISQAGQGVYRLVTILADMIGETPEVLLIDEIENGLDHSIHEQIWTGLVEMAERLNVQVFATTHSCECMEAAHRAFLRRKNYDLGVIQLFRVDDGVQGRVLDREHIEAAFAGDVELR